MGWAIKRGDACFFLSLVEIQVREDAFVGKKKKEPGLIYNSPRALGKVDAVFENAPNLNKKYKWDGL